MTLGNKIQKLRKQKGMSQEKLAEELGVSRQAVSKWELDAALPDIGNIVAISRLFDVTTDYLLKDEQDDAGSNDEKAESEKRDWKKIAGIICASFGTVGIFLTYLISRFVPVMTPIRVYHDGQWYNHWNASHLEVDYIYFVRQYKLQLLIILFAIMIVAGVVLVFGKRLRQFIGKVTAKGRK